MDEKNKRIIVGIIAVICLLIALHFCFRVENGSVWQTDSGYRPVMGTLARVIVVASDKKTAQGGIEAAFEQISKIDELMSYHNPDSELSRVNQNAFKGPVKVSAPTYYVVKKSIEFGKLTDGAFDVTVGPLVDLWHKAADSNRSPTEQQLQQARSKVGCDKLILNDAEQSIRFAVEGMRIDLGGIAKGFAIDKAIESVKDAGCLGALVDIGGDIRCFGTPLKGQEHWLIGLQNPDLESENQNLLELKLTDKAVATSGGYQRFVIIGGKRYSHIINQETGESAEGLSGVTIITDSATDADALATAVSVMGLEKGVQLVENTAETEAIIISPLPNYGIKKTSGAEEFIK